MTVKKKKEKKRGKQHISARAKKGKITFMGRFLSFPDGQEKLLNCAGANSQDNHIFVVTINLSPSKSCFGYCGSKMACFYAAVCFARPEGRAEINSVCFRNDKDYFESLWRKMFLTLCLKESNHNCKKKK